MSYSSAGQFTAAGAIIGGTLLLWATGWFVDFLERRERPDAVIVASLCVSLALAAISCGAALSNATPVAVTLYVFVYALLGVPTLLAGAALQMISPDRIRAQIMAIHLLLVNLVSLSLGPLAVALITEQIFKSPASVGYSLGVVDVVAALAAATIFLLSKKGFLRCNDQVGRDQSTADPDVVARPASG
jgi:MFS family permease